MHIMAENSWFALHKSVKIIIKKKQLAEEKHFKKTNFVLLSYIVFDLVGRLFGLQKVFTQFRFSLEDDFLNKSF